MTTIDNIHIIVDREQIKLPVLDHLKEEGDKKTDIEKILNNSLKNNLASHIREYPDSPLYKIIIEMEPVDFNIVKNLSLKEFVEKNIEGKIREDETLQKEYSEFLINLSDKITIKDFLKLDKALEKNPFFVDIVRNSHLHELLQLTPLKSKNKKIEAFLTVFNKFKGFHEAFWKTLNKERIVNKNEIKDLKLTFELAALTMNNPELVKTLKDQGINSLKDLIPYDMNYWLKLFKDNKITLPDSIKSKKPKESYANHLVESIANMFPTAVFSDRVVAWIKVTDAKEKITADLSRIHNFLKINPQMGVEKEISHPVAWPKDVHSGEARYKIKESWESLKKFIKLYSHLNLEKIINNCENWDQDSKIKEIWKEIGKLEIFFKKNPDLDLQYADFHRGYAATATQDEKTTMKIKWKGFIKEDRKRLINQLKVYQRLFRVYPRFETIKSLLELDFDSAQKITLIPEERFVKHYVEKSHSNEALATRIYNKALGIRENTTLLWANIKDTVASRHFKATRFNNISQEIAQYYTNDLHTSYQEMFGSLNFCECEHCHSIFSPAAYFVDLMRFIDIYIGDDDYKQRILDFLNSETTTWQEIVNAVRDDPRRGYGDQIEDYGIGEEVAKRIVEKRDELGGFSDLEQLLNIPGFGEDKLVDLIYTFAGIPPHLMLKNRRPDLWEIPLDCENTNTVIPYLDIVNEVLERQLGSKEEDKNIPYREKLIKARHPFNMPFNLPLEQIRIYFRHFKRGLFEIYEIFGKAAAEAELATAKAADERSSTVATQAALDAAEAKLTTIKVDVAREYLHISQEELAVLTTSVVDADELKSLYGTSDDLRHLRHQKRFLQHTELSQKELNELLFQNLDQNEKRRDLQSKFFINNVDRIDPEASLRIGQTKIFNLFPKKLDRIHRFVRLSKKLNWSFADLDWVLRSIEKTEPGKDIDADAIRKIAKIKKWQDQYKLPLDILCSFWYTIKDIGKAHPEESGPQDLFNRVFNHPDVLSGRNRYDPDNPGTWRLDNPADENRNRLLAAFELYDDDLNRIVRKITSTDNLELTLDNLSRLYRFSKIPKVLNLSIRELILILELMGKDEITDIDELAALIRLVDWVKTSNFNVYELHYILGGDLNEFVDVSYTIDDIALLTRDLSLDLANLVKQSPTPSDDELKIEKRRLVLEKLGILFSKNPAFLESIIEFAGTNLDAPALITQLFMEITINDPVPADLSDFLRAVHRYVFLVDRFGLKEPEVDSIKGNMGKEVFGIEDIANITIEDIKRLYVFKHLTEAFNDNENRVIGYFREPTGNDDSPTRQSKSEALGRVTNWDEAIIKTLFDHFWITPSPNDNPGYNTVDGLLKLKKCFYLSAYFGVGIDILLEWLKTANGGWDVYMNTANSVLDIWKAKYDEKTWEKIYPPFEDEVRELKRDALSAYAVWNIDKAWPASESRLETLRDLYEYSLIDVEMSSCHTISKIKEGMLALQLYIQRCQMNLEPPVKPESIPEKQWAWMRNYRVWEANRKVFLYPETYIQPELRDNKSPIFKELEAELSQSEITEEAVEKAYKNYLDKFTELANLKIAGSYYDIITEKFYLFGRTNTDPYSYYYREGKNMERIGGSEAWVWTPWEKINLSIKSEFISPIYAFNKLFIFWAEISTTEETRFVDGTSQDPIEMRRFVIKFSYYKFNKNWTQPQTFRWQDSVTCFEYDSFATKNYPRYQDPFWKRVYPIVIGDHILTEDRSLLFSNIYGGDTNILVKQYNNLRAFTGQKRDYLEYVYLYLLKIPRTMRGSLVPVRDPILTDSQNYYEMAESFAYGFYGSPPILSNISDQAIIKVINNSQKPNWVIFDNTDEEFLIQSNIPTKYDYDPNESWQVSFGSPHKFTRISTNSIHKLSQQLIVGGIDELLSIQSQQTASELRFKRLDPNLDLIVPPTDSGSKLDFKGAYGLYYREIFFHIPFLIANRLNTNQKFEEAQKWYHYLYNPTISTPESGIPPEDTVWRYLPFRALDLETLHDMLTNPNALDAYHNDPFNPHIIARLRLNAYQKTIVMNYIDNLLDWGDFYFERYTWESLMEAIMLYVLAYELLGPRPEKLEVCELSDPKTFENIKDLYETGAAIPEFWIDLENAPSVGNTGEGSEPNPNPDVLLYFCIPENAEFIDYWERVEDRLYKIRHCMTIKGVVRQPALFEPPIPPMALVRAVAGGRDIGSVLADMARPMPHYRFTFMLEKAKNLSSVVQQFGSALLSALEKKDAEELALLRSTHEKNILQLTTTLKEKQKEGAIESHAALLEGKASAITRNSYYKKLIEKNLSPHEKLHLASMEMAWEFEQQSSLWNTLGSLAHLIPQLGAPTAITFGGNQIGTFLTAVASSFRNKAAYQNYTGSMSSVLGSHERQRQDWELQRDLSQHDIDQLEKQIAAAELQIVRVEEEIAIHEKNIEQTDAVYDFLKDKFSNKDLYQWMVSQLSGIYFQTYKMAYDLAKSAEKAYQYEKNTIDTYINFGHWDSLKKGLLAGERLALELHQLERAYIDDNERSLEIEKTISLAQLLQRDPTDNGVVLPALLALKETGTCEFELTEELFDYDFPGHYCRKIKTISISIPAIVGPYQDIKATLTQIADKILLESNESAISYLLGLNGDPPDTSILRSNWRREERIAISKGLNDSGLFELNFRDERYLPFEGTGAISAWRLEMPKATNRIDFDSIADVIIHLKYTALSGGDTFKDAVITALNEKPFAGYRILSLRHEFSTAWHEFLNPAPGEPHKLELAISEKQLPLNITNYSLPKIFLKLFLSSVELVATSVLQILLKPAIQDAIEFDFRKDTPENTIEKSDRFSFGNWVLTINRKKGIESEIPSELRRQKDDTDDIETIESDEYYYLDPKKVQNIGLILVYEGQAFDSGEGS